MGTHVIPRELPRPAELGQPVHPGENGELMGHLAEVAALCSRLQSDVGVGTEPRAVFEAALPVLRRLVDFRATAFFTVDEGGVDFALSGVEPPEERAALERELRLQVDEGTFTWALYRSHSVLVPTLGRRGRVLMHALTTSGGVRGMFFGVLPVGSSFIPEVTRELISIVLFNCAGVLESAALNRRLTSYSEELEATVRTRTRALRSSEEEAREANRVKSEFLAHTSHEIRSPINGIVGTLGILERTPLSPEQRELVKTVGSSARILLRLAGDVLDLSRIEAGRMEVERTAMGLREVVDGAVGSASLRARKRGLDLWIEWDRRLPQRMVGDAGRVRQILDNLLDNAVKFTARGEVVLACRLAETDAGELVRLEVRDTGPGIASDDRERIFERFTQVGASDAHGERGAGLGLAIARDLARLMGGDLVLEVGPERGSAFTLTLPLVLGERPGLPAVDSPRRVLVASSDRRVAEVLAEEIAWMGGSVEATTSVAEALDRAACGEGVAAVLIDVALAPEAGDLAGATGCRIGFVGPPDAPSELRGLPVLRRPWLHRPLRAVLGWAPTEAGASSVGEQPAAPHRLAELRVLVVDDDAVTRTVLGRILEELECQHVAVGTATEALERLDAEVFDVVLMDGQLPGLGGEEAARRIRAREARRGHPPVRIVAVTGHSRPDVRASMLDAGMEEVLVKPVTIEAIARVLARRGHSGLPMGEERFHEVGLTALSQAWPERRDALRRAAAEGDIRGVATEAHRMKGAGALVGAHEVADLATSLEMAARTTNTARISVLLDELDHIMEQTLQEIGT